jgi:hypothetical protein
MTLDVCGGGMAENKNVVEMHGCIVCARIFNMLVVYSPDGRLLDCTVASPGGKRVPDERRPLVACDTHSEETIKMAYEKWKLLKDKSAGNDQEDE